MFKNAELAFFQRELETVFEVLVRVDSDLLGLLLYVVIRHHVNGDPWRQDSGSNLDHNPVSLLIGLRQIVESLEDLSLDVGSVKPKQFIFSPFELGVCKLEDALCVIQFVSS